MYGDQHRVLDNRFQAMKRRILARYADKIESIHVKYQCEFETELRSPRSDIFKFFNSEGMLTQTKPIPIMAIRSGCRGGTTCLYQMVAHASKTYKIHYLDVNSLYPFIAMKNNFIVGPGIRLLVPEMILC